MRFTAEETTRFMARIAAGSSVSESGCRMWMRAKSRDGYGVIKVKGRCVQAHRVAWSLIHGPIPAGKMVCHRCDTPACVEVEHMFIGGAADNVRDMLAKGRGRCNAIQKVSDEDAAAIILARRAGVGSRVLADRYGVARTTINEIARGAHRKRLYARVVGE